MGQNFGINQSEANNNENMNNNNNSINANNINYLEPEQRERMERLFSYGIRPDVSLLHYQMPRMKKDKPPSAKKRKTIPMRNLIHLNKKSVHLNHLGNNKYRLIFNYSCDSPTYITIYYFCNDIVNNTNCTVAIKEKFRRPIFDTLDRIQNRKNTTKIDYKNYNGTSYLLDGGMNVEFKQNNKDYTDLNDINIRYYQYTPTLRYYPIIIVFTKTFPQNSLFCKTKNKIHAKQKNSILGNPNDDEDTYQDTEEESKTDDNTSNSNTSGSKDKLKDLKKDKTISEFKYVDKLVCYGKLILTKNNIYDIEIVSEKIEAFDKSYNSQDIYGLDRQVDPYSGEDNLCVVCITNKRDTALKPCRHLCMCETCANRLLSQSNKCPICRGYCSGTIKIANTTYIQEDNASDTESNSDNSASDDF